MTSDSLSAEIAKIRWWHQIDLGNGIQTPGPDNSTDKLNAIDFPADLTGKSVLDIGAWDGFFSFEAERRGASRVVAVDTFVWQGKSGFSKAGYELAHRVLKSKVVDRELEVLDPSPENVGTFDVVLFLGVLYHMRHPLLALEKVYSVTKDLMILETHIDLRQTPWPAMRFYPTNELNTDHSNWWGPNPAAVIAMVEAAGFSKVKVISMQPSGEQEGRFTLHAQR